jgi:beta-glucosidase
VTRKSYGKEAVDRQSLELEAEGMVELMFKANPNTVLVLISSFPYAINWSEEHLPAILHLTHSSQELGNALADVLFGDENPAGRLVQTWPRALDHLPEMLDYDLTHGRTYMYAEHEALYPFGFGLSYTTFVYQSLRVLSNALGHAGGRLLLAVELTNTGDLAGAEVVQLYVRYPQSQVARPQQQLVDFKRVPVAPGATLVVELSIDSEQLAYWDSETASFVVEAGPIEVQVGSSSRQIALRQLVSVV